MSDDTRSSNTVLPCIFCQETEVSMQENGGSKFWVSCDSCASEGPVRGSERAAALAWNAAHRAAHEPSDAPKFLVDEVVEYLPFAHWTPKPCKIVAYRTTEPQHQYELLFADGTRLGWIEQECLRSLTKTGTDADYGGDGLGIHRDHL